MVETVSISHFKDIEQTFSPIRGAEFVEVHRQLYEKNPEEYGEGARTRMETALKTKLDDYVQALRQRELLRRKITTFFQNVDVVILPSLPCAAPPVATLKAKVNGKDIDYPGIHRPFLSPHNYTGCPALTLPMGFSREELPLPLQIAGPHWEEAIVLRVAHSYQEATPEFRANTPSFF